MNVTSLFCCGVIHEMFIDQVVEEYGLLVVHDIYGGVHILTPPVAISSAPSVPLENFEWAHAYHTDNWPNTTGWHDLYNTAAGLKFSIVTSGEYLLDTIVLAQTGTNIVSLVELRVGTDPVIILPVLEESVTHLDEPLNVPSGSILTARVKPGHKNTKVALTLGGYYT